MASRDDVVQIALSQVGYHTEGQGYDERCKFSQLFLGPVYGDTSEGGYGPDDTPILAWCDIFISWCFHQAGVPLPAMPGSMLPEGQQYCPSSWAYADARGATRSSWEAQPADQVIFDWTGTGNLGPSSHTELVVKYEAPYLYTVGGNSGPAGGVNQHAWYAPPGVGNSLIMGVIDTSQLVTFNAPNEEFTVDAEAKQAFADLNAKLDQMIQIFEGGFDPKRNPFGLVGFRDVKVSLDKIAAKVGAK